MLRAQDEAIERAHKYGYVSTLWGGRRHLSVMMHDDYEFHYKEGSNPEFDPYEPELTLTNNTVNPRKSKEYMEKLKKCKYRKEKDQLLQELTNQGIEVVDYTYKKSDTSRKALNGVIQGSAANMSKLSMIYIDQDPRLREINTYLLLMIHDEVICECPQEHLAAAVEYIKEDMVKCTSHLPVPFISDAEVSTAWYGPEVDYDDEGDIIDEN